jgi:chemotaxis protein MotB
MTKTNIFLIVLNGISRETRKTMPDMDTNASDKQASIAVSDPESASKSPAASVRISPSLLTPTPSADLFRGTGLPADNFSSADENLWSIPWANLMMVLFVILFMLISLQSKDFQTTASDRSGTEQPLLKESVNNHAIKQSTTISARPRQSTTTAGQLERASRSATAAALLAQIGNAIAASNNDQFRATLIADQAIRLSLAADMLFETDTAELTQPARQLLQQLVVPLRDTQQQIHIIGHTDDQDVDNRRYADNWALSLARASAVTRYLIDPGKVEAGRFTIMGRAQYQPLVSNLIARSRAMNRRVDIIIAPDAYPPAEKKP